MTIATRDYTSLRPLRTEYTLAPPSRRWWSRQRAAIIARDGGCLLCGSTAQLSIHHIKPRVLGRDDSPRNLVTLCRAHHLLLDQLGLWAGACVVWAVGTLVLRTARLLRA